MKLFLRICPRAEEDHKVNRRYYAHVGHYKGAICIASAFNDLPVGHKMGIIAHEVGHLLLVARGMIKHSEEMADRMAEEHFGFHIHRVDSIYGKNLEYLPIEHAIAVKDRVSVRRVREGGH